MPLLAPLALTESRPTMCGRVGWQLVIKVKWTLVPLPSLLRVGFLSKFLTKGLWVCLPLSNMDGLMFGLRLRECLSICGQ